MIYGKNKEGNEVTLTLTGEEAKDFVNDIPVIDRKASRKGVVEIEVKKRITCPNAETRATLRKVASAGFTGNVGEAIELLSKDVDSLPIDAQQLHLRVTSDLRKYVNTLGFDADKVPVAEISEG